MEAAYVLASWQPTIFGSALRTTLRWDTFKTVERDFSAGENNDEHGEAWTAALFWEPRADLRLGLEWLRVRAQHSEAGAYGVEGIRVEGIGVDGDQLTLELRYFFDF